MAAIVTLAGCLLAFQTAGGSEWWSSDWKFRRSVTVTNHLERPLEKGYTLEIEIDPDYLGIRGKSKSELDDWALVRGRERLPHLLAPGSGKKVRLCFRTPVDLPAGGSERYYLYYGAPGAHVAPAPPGDIYELWEDFARPEALAERFAADPELTLAVQDHALVVSDVAPGCTASSPAQIRFRRFPRLAGFELSFEFEMTSEVPAGAGFSLHLDLAEPRAKEESIEKQVDALIVQLGDDRWEAREAATRSLIGIGRPAALKLAEAARSTDAEVKWRAAHVLREISERHPAPRISAGVSGGDPRMPVKLATVIGRSQSALSHKTGWPVKATLLLQRDSDGEVRILWNGRHPQSGQMPGEVEAVALSIWKGTTQPLGTLRICKVSVRRFVDDDSRPTSAIDVEEPRP
jgi:hypothetical protein